MYTSVHPLDNTTSASIKKSTSHHGSGAVTLTGMLSPQMTQPFWEEDGRASGAPGSWSLSESGVKVWGNTLGQEPRGRLRTLNWVLTLPSKIT